MSSGFISEAELAEQRRIRQEEWDKVRKPGQPEEVPEEEYDHRSLFERLEEQKNKRELEYEEAHRLKNMIKGLDDDEVEFLDLVDRSKLEEERRKCVEEAREMKDFRDAVATLQEKSLEERINTEIRPRPLAQMGSSSGRSSQVRLLAGAVVRKRSAETAQITTEPASKKPCNNDVTSNNKEHPENLNSSLPTKEVRDCGNIQEDSSDTRKRKQRGDVDDENVQPVVHNGVGVATGLQCIGILPGLGYYPDSSDSEQSSDTDQELPTSTGFDLLGRKVTRQVKTAKASSGR